MLTSAGDNRNMFLCVETKNGFSPTEACGAPGKMTSLPKEPSIPGAGASVAVPELGAWLCGRQGSKPGGSGSAKQMPLPLQDKNGASHWHNLNRQNREAARSFFRPG